VDQRIKKKGNSKRKNKKTREEWVKMRLRMMKRSSRIRRMEKIRSRRCRGWRRVAKIGKRVCYYDDVRG
jgi:hypothetical protein